MRNWQKSSVPESSDDVSVLHTSALPALGPSGISITWTQGTCCVQRKAGRPARPVARNHRALDSFNISENAKIKSDDIHFDTKRRTLNIDLYSPTPGSRLTEFVTGKLLRLYECYIQLIYNGLPISRITSARSSSWWFPLLNVRFCPTTNVSY